MTAALGLKAEEGAHKLKISKQTYRNHLSDIFAKLDVDNLISALLVVGWLQVPQDYEESP